VYLCTARDSLAFLNRAIAAPGVSSKCRATVYIFNRGAEQNFCMPPNVAVHLDPLDPLRQYLLVEIHLHISDFATSPKVSDFSGVSVLGSFSDDSRLKERSKRMVSVS